MFLSAPRSYLPLTAVAALALAACTESSDSKSTADDDAGPGAMDDDDVNGGDDDADDSTDDDDAPADDDDSPADDDQADDDSADGPDAGDGTAQDDAGVDLPPNTGPYRSGSRLTVRVTSDGQGAETFTSLYDTELEQYCSFQQGLGDDQTYHCISAGFSLPYFADDACTEPVVTSGSTCLPIKVGGLVQLPVASTSGCGVERFEYLEVVAPISPAAVYRLDAEGQCVMQEVGAGSEYFSAVAADPQNYVSATRRVDLVDEEAQLSVGYLDGEDGSSVQVDLLYADETCYPDPYAADNGWVCMPGTYGHLGGPYVSADCMSDPVIEVTQDECNRAEPSYILSYPDSCGGQYRVYEVGEVVDGPKYSEVIVDQCDEQSIPANQILRAFGDELPLGTFPSLPVVESGSDRLRALSVAATAGRPTQRSEWYDQELGVACTPAIMTDGTRRCVPQGNSYASGSYFSDADCSVGLYATGELCDERTQDYAVYTRSDTDPELPRCSTHVDRVVLLEPYTGTIYRALPDCQAVELTEALRLFAEVRDVEIDELIELEVVDK